MVSAGSQRGVHIPDQPRQLGDHLREPARPLVLKESGHAAVGVTGRCREIASRYRWSAAAKPKLATRVCRTSEPSTLQRPGKPGRQGLGSGRANALTSACSLATHGARAGQAGEDVIVGAGGEQPKAH